MNIIKGDHVTLKPELDVPGELEVEHVGRRLIWLWGQNDNLFQVERDDIATVKREPVNVPVDSVEE